MDTFNVLTLVIVVTLSSVTGIANKKETVDSSTIKISDDVFFGYGGRVTQQLNAGHNDSSTTKPLTRPSSLRRLEILENDELIVGDHQASSTCKLTGNYETTTEEDIPKNATVHFAEIAKV